MTTTTNVEVGEGPQRRGGLRAGHLLGCPARPRGRAARGRPSGSPTRSRQVPLEKNIHTGLRDQRHVIFDNGTRLMWATTFENDWDPYFEDFVLIGIEHFLDWMQHTAQYTHVAEWLESSGGVEKFRLDNPDVEAQMKRSVGGLKAIVQSVQSPATGYFNNLRDVDDAGDRQGPAREAAFQRVLDDPAAEEALQHPALKPLLDQAAD